MFPWWVVSNIWQNNFRSEDELTLTVYVWSVETPYNMMYRNLVKEFAPDMRNIKIGPVYEDQGNNLPYTT